MLTLMPWRLSLIEILVVLPYIEIKDTFEEVINTFKQPGINISITPNIGIGSDPTY